MRLKCNFDIERGCMIKRNLVEHMNGKVYTMKENKKRLNIFFYMLKYI